MSLFESPSAVANVLLKENFILGAVAVCFSSLVVLCFVTVMGWGFRNEFVFCFSISSGI